MKRFEAVNLAALMIFILLEPAACAQVSNSLELRSQMYDGSDINQIITTYGTGGTLTMDANNFVAFFYDIDNDISTETLSIKEVPGTDGNTIGLGGLVYQTTIGNTKYEYEPWGNYNVLGLFSDKYVPLISTNANNLSKLILDSGDKYTLKTGEKLDFGNGYSLLAKRVDVEGNVVKLEFDKDGEYVDEKTVNTTIDKNWTCKLDNIKGEDDVPVLKVRVNQVFHGEVDEIAQIEGLWLIDYVNITEIQPDSEFGNLNNVNISGPTLTISNDDTMNLTRDSDVEIGKRMFFKVTDTDALRFYTYKLIKDPGDYRFRGKATTGNKSWDATNFAGFFYDLKNNVATEKLKVSGLSGREIPKGGLVYTTTIQKVDYDYNEWGQYLAIGFFGEEYFTLGPSNASKLAKLVNDSNENYTLKTGEKLNLGQGYTLEAKKVDFEGNEVRLEFGRYGRVDNSSISIDSGNYTWTIKRTVLNIDNVPVLKVHVNQVYQSAVDSIALIDGIWLIDYENPEEIQPDSEFGNLNNISINGSALTISNDDAMNLTRNSDVEIGHEMNFRVADSADLRYYPYIVKTIGNTLSPEPTLPIANFIASVTEGCVPLSMQFTDLSTDSNGWIWDFGDGAASTEQNPVHIYSAAGNYIVSLTVSNTNGVDSKAATINVLTPQQKIQQMTTKVRCLVTSEKLNKGQGNSLTVKLNAATKQLNKGDTKAATNELNAFINQVNAFNACGKFSQTEGQGLIDAACSVINALK